jgi:hypothetical protein
VPRAVSATSCARLWCGFVRKATSPFCSSASTIRCTDCRVSPILSAMRTTGAGPACRAIAPRTCHRALVSPILATKESPEAIMRPLSRNTSSTSSVSVSVAGVVAMMTGYCHIDRMLSTVTNAAGVSAQCLGPVSWPGVLADARTSAGPGRATTSALESGSETSA